MKGRLAALGLCCALALTGCASLSASTYTVVEPHAEHPNLGEDSSTLKASTYSELVNGVLFFVSQGMEEGIIQLTDYHGDVEEDLNRACLEVAKDDPLGAYAVDFIKNDYTTVITTYEATITISYRRSQEQISSLVNITGTSAIQEEAAQALLEFRDQLALRVGYFTGDAAAVEEQVRQAYYDTPAAALGMPVCTVSLYPETGAQRIVEILLEYPQDTALLRRRSGQLQERAEELVAPLLTQNQSAARRLNLLLELLPQAVKPGGQGSTAWDALLGEGADSQGLALAFQLLGDQMSLDSDIVEGTLEGVPRFFNQVTLSGEPVYVDLARDMGRTWTAQEMAQMGYVWAGQEGVGEKS